jgi:fatty acid desaturase
MIGMLLDLIIYGSFAVALFFLILYIWPLVVGLVVFYLLIVGVIALIAYPFQKFEEWAERDYREKH